MTTKYSRVFLIPITSYRSDCSIYNKVKLYALLSLPTVECQSSHIKLIRFTILCTVDARCEMIDTLILSLFLSSSLFLSI